MSTLIYGNIISNCGKAGISVSGLDQVDISHNYISDTPTGIELTDCKSANVKNNKGTRIKTFVRINEDLEIPMQRKIKNIKYQMLFNKKIKELLSVEAQLKFLKDYEKLKKIRFLKANLKLKF